MSEQYRIESVHDFTTVPDDRLDDCLLEFAEAVRLFRSTAAVLGAISGGGVTSTMPAFTWIDDGKTDKTVRFLLPDEQVP